MVDALRVCATHPSAKANTFFVSDSRPLSTCELIQGLAKGLDKRAYFFYTPKFLMRFPLKLLKKDYILEQITESLQLDISLIKKTLGWSPPISVEEGLKKTGTSFR